MTQNLFIHNCEILNVENNQASVLTQQDILILGNRIKSIHASGQISSETIPPDTQILDAQGLLAVPGLINTHAHVPMVLFRGIAEDVTGESWFNDYIFPLEYNLTAEDVYWGAMLGIAEMIENGITTVADHYFFMDQVAQAVKESGMRANLVWAVFGHQGETKLDETAEFVKRWQGAAGGRITTWLGPHAPYTCPPEFLRLSARKAKELNVGIHIHVSETMRQVEMSLDEHGLTPVQVLLETGVMDVPTILAHCSYPQEVDFPILASHHTGIAHAPKTYLKHASGMVSLPGFHTSGIPVGLATDGAVSSNTLDILEQMRLTALMQKYMVGDPTQMTIGEVLDITFKGGARVIQREVDLGEIAPGKLADIVLIRQDGLSVFPRYNPAANLVYSGHSSDVDTVICDGKVLMHKRQLLTLDKGRIKAEIIGRLERLSQRVPGKRIAFYPS
jgi:5-methylthioadenosine/S-adenosylhomocysteine deaminase